MLSDWGVIVRTAGDGHTSADLEEDLIYLARLGQYLS